MYDAIVPSKDIEVDRHDDVMRKLEPTASEGPPDRRHFALYALSHRNMCGIAFDTIFYNAIAS